MQSIQILANIAEDSSLGAVGPHLRNTGHPVARLTRMAGIKAQIGYKLRSGKYGGKPEDRDHAHGVYQKNTSDVQAHFSSDRLLTYQLGDGWEPLCRFWGKPIPNIGFPKNNSTEQFRAHILKK